MSGTMDKAPLSLELVPLDPAPGSKPAPATLAPVDSGPPESSGEAIEIVPLERVMAIRGGTQAHADPYAAQASLEYARGHIDAPLWDRALGQANGDTTAAAAIYVRARGTALRLLDRGRRADRRAGERAAAVADENWKRPKEVSVWRKHRYAIAGGGAVALLVVAGIVWMTAGTSDDAVVTAPVIAKPARKAPPAVAAAPEAPKPSEAGPTTDFLKKVQDLRDAGNWNVLVLYAVEWTRKEPGNAAAWDNLRDGYQRLRQFEDARSAATKAVQLAPDDARLWRKLADVNLDIDDPAGALAAFEQAAARNGHDVDSLQQIALLEARLGHAAETKAAFDRALAVSPGDPVTTCLRTGVAQMPPARDAYTMALQVRAIDNRCHGREAAVASAK